MPNWENLPAEIQMMVWERMYIQEWATVAQINSTSQQQIMRLEYEFLSHRGLDIAVREKNVKKFKIWKEHYWDKLTPREKNCALEILFFLFGWHQTSYFIRQDFLKTFFIWEDEYIDYYEYGRRKTLDFFSNLEGWQQRMWKQKIGHFDKNIS